LEDTVKLEIAFPTAVNNAGGSGKLKIPDSAVNESIMKTFKTVIYISDAGNLVKRVVHIIFHLLISPFYLFLMIIIYIQLLHHLKWNIMI